MLTCIHEQTNLTHDVIHDSELSDSFVTCVLLETWAMTQPETNTMCPEYIRLWSYLHSFHTSLKFSAGLDSTLNFKMLQKFLDCFCSQKGL